MAFTQLIPSGVSGRRYGSFAGKTFDSHPVVKITQLMGGAVPTRRYGSFHGKNASGGGGVVAMRRLITLIDCLDVITVKG